MAKASIHPNYQLATITCACGAVYETASTRGSFHVEICARCHPFYTGKQKLIDSAGRIERFQKRYQLRPGASAIETAEAKPRPAAAEGGEKPAKPAKPENKNENKGGDNKPKGEAKGGDNKPKGENPQKDGDGGANRPKGDKPKGEAKPA